MYFLTTAIFFFQKEIAHPLYQLIHTIYFLFCSKESISSYYNTRDSACALNLQIYARLSLLLVFIYLNATISMDVLLSNASS
jgi:hypothetical protein